MKPSAMRNLNWVEVQGHLTEDLKRVHVAWRDFGPGTTRAVAERSGISLLTLRPRTTDLFQLGLVDCIGQAEGSASGVYEYVADATAALMWESKRKALPTEKPRRAGAGEKLTRGTLAWAARIMAQARATKGARRIGNEQTELFA